MSLYLIFPAAVLIYMAFCLARLTSMLCKAIAMITLIWSAITIAAYLSLVPGFLMEHWNYVMRISLIATALFVVQLWRTGSETKSRGETGAEYNFILATALILMVVVSFSDEISFFNASWFYRLRVRIWPELAVLITVIRMKVKKVILDKDEDMLLWYYGGSCLWVLGHYFL